MMNSYSRISSLAVPNALGVNTRASFHLVVLSLVRFFFSACILAVMSTNVLANAQELNTEPTPAAELISSVQSSSVPTTPASTALATTDFKLVGQADLDLLWFSVYSAKLMSVDGEYKNQQYPLKLEIQYHRDIDAEDLIEATVEQWQHIGIEQSRIPQLQAHLEGIWPDVKQGDTLSFMMHEQNKGQFFYNEQPLAMILEPGFADAFLGIWLSENTSRPKLRQQLIGVKK
ncbi:chalcone isomerase family protein [Shewanella sp. 3_MG-2023]|uniref:chalcone isomerase family protein n=1 Tax=Shewanella sp. 3_MG-2023 TaxID=3062635 RepID=UPI0026E1EB02|nr:chalcone isomerase family protein [Shewanella sp. 3_MG-2023]MDO6773849.1 chalcone isomerase family protein [Shewanella sp. 3_MG-2023]